MKWTVESFICISFTIELSRSKAIPWILFSVELPVFSSPVIPEIVTGVELAVLLSSQEHFPCLHKHFSFCFLPETLIFKQSDRFLLLFEHVQLLYEMKFSHETIHHSLWFIDYWTTWFWGEYVNNNFTLPMVLQRLTLLFHTVINNWPICCFQTYNTGCNWWNIGCWYYCDFSQCWGSGCWGCRSGRGQSC